MHNEFLAFYSHFQFTFDQMTSLPVTWGPWVIFCHVTASSCEVQPGRRWNVQNTQAFGLLHPLPGNFRSNDVTSGTLPINWGHVTSFPVKWLLPLASYSFVGREMDSICKFLAFHSHFQVTSGQITSLLGNFWGRKVTWRHFL